MNKAKKNFGDLSIVRGNKNTFLVMNIDIKYIIQIYMVNKLEECIPIFVEDVSVNTPNR